jgi:hypothetical protein
MPEDQGELSQKLQESSLNLNFIKACRPDGRAGMNFSVVKLEVSDRRWSVKRPERKLP